MAEKLANVKKEGKLKKWYRETIGELRKVSWPTPREAWRLTKIVILVIVVMGVLLGGLDFLFTRIIKLVVG